MKNFLVLFITILLGLLVACEKPATKPADNNLSGRWTEQIPDGMAYYEATLHSFSFDKDSFNAKILSWTDVVEIIYTRACDTCPRIIDSCASNFGHDEIYVRGTYTQRNDSIYFAGKTCDSLYQRDIQPRCNGIADYNEKFLFAKNDTAIILNSDKASSFGYGIILKKE